MRALLPWDEIRRPGSVNDDQQQANEQEAMNVLITGGTGTLGRHLEREVAAGGHHVRILSRRAPSEPVDRISEWVQADLATGRGLKEAIKDVDVVIHCASDPAGRKPDVDVQGTQRLIEAASHVSLDHVLFPSIVGVDDIPFPYYRRKREAERIIEASDLPSSIFRATQFHAFLNQIIGTVMRIPLAAPLPTGWPMQTVAASDVASRLVLQLNRGPGGRLPNFGGPEIFSLGKYARKWMNASRVRKRLLPVPVPGKTARGFREGRHTDPERKKGRLTWDEWLSTEQSQRGDDVQ